MSDPDDRRGPAPAGSAPGPERRPVRTPPTAGPRCELCGASMLDRHCKLVCLNCGYQRDCSDP